MIRFDRYDMEALRNFEVSVFSVTNDIRKLMSAICHPKVNHHDWCRRDIDKCSKRLSQSIQRFIEDIEENTGCPETGIPLDWSDEPRKRLEELLELAQNVKQNISFVISSPHDDREVAGELARSIYSMLYYMKYKKPKKK